MKFKVSKYVADRISRKKKDFRVDTFCAGGKGGMNQNAVNSAVRITDLKTGLAVDCREERDQPQNKSKAFERLVKKLIEFYKKEELNKESERIHTEVIRTYKLDKGYVVDHRLKKQFPAKDIMKGDLTQIHEEVLTQIKKS